MKNIKKFICLLIVTVLITPSIAIAEDTYSGYFNNDEIKYTVTEYYDGKKQIAFEYNETMIIQVKLSSESNSTIDKEKLFKEERYEQNLAFICNVYWIS